MSNSYTNSNSGSYSAADTRNVLGKMKDDFMNVIYRGFTSVSASEVLGWWQDVEFVATQKALKKCQLKFNWDGKTASITYDVVADGSIKINTESAATNFYLIPKNATVSIVISRDQTNATVDAYLQRKGWTSTGSFHSGAANSGGAYSSGNFGVNISTIGFQ